MKKFISNIFFAVILVTLGYGSVAVFRAEENTARFGSEVFDAIAKSAICYTNAVNVILGDSVSRQLFSPTFQNETTNFIYLASNQAITPIGNLALLKRYLANNPKTKNVYYMALPGSLTNDGTASYTFHYLIYPFFETRAFQYIDDSEVMHLKRRFTRYVFDVPFVRQLINANDEIYTLYYISLKRWLVPKKPLGEIPETCKIVLAKMDQLCKERGVRFHLISSPVTESSAGKNEEIIHNLSEVKSEYMKQYMKSQIQVPDCWCFDGIHFKLKILETERQNIISELFRRIDAQWP